MLEATSRRPLMSEDQYQKAICNGFEITFVSEKHVVEDDVLFTNHLAGK